MKTEVLHEPVNANCTDPILPSYSMYKSLLQKKIQRHHGDLPAYGTDAVSVAESIGSAESVALPLKNLDQLPVRQEAISLEVVVTEGPNEGGKPHLPALEEKEYRPDEYVYGYVLIRNTSKTVIPFSVLYVLLEGHYQYDDKLTHKVVSMIDLNASMSNDTVPQTPFDKDGTCLVMNNILKPKVIYKRFFTFRIPQYILDLTCTHYLSEHLLTPPSFGGFGRYRDFGLATSWLKYHVQSYVIGEDSKRFVVMAHDKAKIRIIPRHIPHPVEAQNYRFFLSRLTQDLQIFNKRKFDELLLRLYGNKALKKGPVKVIGHYAIEYVPPIVNHPGLNQVLELKLEAPVADEVVCELVITTVELSNYSIPFTIEPYMVFDDTRPYSNFHDIVCRPYKQLHSAIKSLDLHPYVTDNIKRLGNLQCHYTYLSVDGVKYNQSESILRVQLPLRYMYIKKLDKAVRLNRFGGFTLVPTFQTCYMTRMYFVRVNIRTGRKWTLVHVPVEVQ